MALAGLACGGYTMWRRRKLAGSRRLLLLCAVIAIAAGRSSTPTLAQSVNYEVVPVGDAGNAADTTGYGAVAYDYQIGKYDVTIGQYTAFLNAVAATDTYSLYNASMASDLAVAGISRAGFAGSYTYSVINNGGDSANRPITYVSWWDSARFANWMANGQPTGAQNSTTTENGAYNVNGATSGNAPTKNVMNPNTGTAPTFFIPTENEWYKAAYYSPALNGGTGGYYRYATQSNTPPGNTIGSLVNQANYYNGVYCVTQSSTTSPDQNYLTDVGAFTNSASYYGTFDQSGNVCQWNDLDGIVADVRGLRGGYWDDGSNYVSSSIRFTFATGLEYSPIFGFRLAAPAAVPEPSALFSLAAGLAFGGWHVLKRRRRRVASVISRSIAALLGATCSVMTIPALAVNYEMVTVGDVGNVADTTGYGAVAYDYQIGKYDVTIGQYTAFLNAVAATDTYSLYKASMGTVKNSRGISRTGVSGSYSYSVIGPDGVVNGQSGANRPITYVSWFDSARFANWMANGQPTGAQTNATTENGAYNLNGATSGTAPAKNVMNPNTSAAPTYVIPTENEWYKAAYYSPVLNSGSGGYYTYATQSNADPGNQIGTGSNQANYARGRVFSVTQSASYSSSQNYLTDVGAFTNSASFYGAFDQSGNVYQWNDLDGTPGSSRGLRGGNWDGFGAFNLSSSGRNTPDPSLENIYFGFRLASPVVVPEPSTWVMGLAGLACGGWQVFRRRRAR